MMGFTCKSCTVHVDPAGTTFGSTGHTTWSLVRCWFWVVVVSCCFHVNAGKVWSDSINTRTSLIDSRLNVSLFKGSSWKNTCKYL